MPLLKVTSNATVQNVKELVMMQQQLSEQATTPALAMGGDTLSTKEKVKRYSAGRYYMKPPPVCSTYWDERDWIKHIDSTGGWT
jgi:hypothetical protein